MRVFKPSNDHAVLQSNCGRVIRLRENFFLATRDPLLSLRNSPVHYPPGPQYVFVQAARVSTPTIVEGVQRTLFKRPPGMTFYDNMLEGFDARDHGITATRGLLPAGSLVMRHFDRATRQPQGDWYAMTPEQVKMQNFIRRLVMDSSINNGMSWSVGHTPGVSKRYITIEYPDGPEKAAHLADIAQQASIESLYGRARSLLTHLTMNR